MASNTKPPSDGKPGPSPMDILTGHVDPPAKMAVDNLRFTPMGTLHDHKLTPEGRAYLKHIADLRDRLTRVPLAPEIKPGGDLEPSSMIEERGFKRARDNDLEPER